MKRLSLVLCVFLSAASALAQLPATGFPPYGSFEDGRFDAVNRQNLDVNFAVPIAAVPGRGTDFVLNITHDSLLWYRLGNFWRPYNFAGGRSWGWMLEQPIGSIEYSEYTDSCWYFDDWGFMWEAEYEVYEDYRYTDPAGTTHFFSLVRVVPDPPVECEEGFGVGFTNNAAGADDGSGYYLDANTPWAPVVTSPTGLKITETTMTDTNGNKISASGVDTAGRNVLAIVKFSTYTEYKVLDQNGGYQITRLNFTPYNIKTNFGCSGVTEYTGTASLPTSIVLPNLRQYTITYEETPGFPGYKTGRVERVTLPTGGYYEYQYPDTPNNGINCEDGTVKSLTRVISEDGVSPTATWTFSRALSGSDWITTVTTPALPYLGANQSTYTFNSSGQLITTKLYEGSATSGTLLRTINTTWAANGTPASTTVILEDSKQSKTETDFDAYTNLLEVREYSWGSGAPGPIVRTTQMTYLSTGPYTTRNIRNLLTQRIVRAGGAGGTIKSRTDITYDESAYSNSPCITGAAQHDDPGYGCSFYARGNATTVTTYTSPVGPSGGIAKHFKYDSLGNLREADLDCCQKHVNNFSSTTQYAYPDSVVKGNGTTLTTSATYKFNTGRVATSTDENSKVTTFTYDIHNRITNVNRPDNQNITYSYDDVNRIITVEGPVQGSDRLRQKSFFDGLGRPIKQEVRNQANTLFSIVETQYDELGRAFKVSNPHTGTALWTESRFDALGRQTTVIAPDGNSTTFSYSGFTVTVTDPTGKQRKSETDALGRLLKVYEPDVNNGNALTQLTTNTFDVLNRLTQVAQGSQTRTFVYDGLGRLTSQTTPEAGTVSFLYNSYSLVTKRTDARAISKNFSYDGLNRLTQATYTDSTPTVSLTYGTSTESNNKGRLITVTYNGSSNTESFTYDVLGRITQATKKIDNVNYAISYAYNLASELASITYPSGRVATQSYDTIGRLTTIASGGVNYASGFGYNAAGQVLGLNYGNGVTAAFTFSGNRLQLTSLKYTKGANTLFNTTYGYSQGGGNNGQITKVTDLVDNGRTVDYTYDALARLKTAVTVGSGSYAKWGLSWSYDRYGNRNQTVTVSDGNVAGTSLSFGATTNRITSGGFAYDASGNMTNDALNTYTYDAENRIKTVNGSGATYSYDGASQRVKKVVGGTTTRYIFSGTKVIAEYVNGALSKEYIYSGSKLLVTLTGSTPTYHHSDHLSVRLNTKATGTPQDIVAGEQGHYPFGESWYATSTTTKWQFTTYERDSESSLDYAMFRYDNSRLGRFMTPDLLAGSIANPQSLNRYAYTQNDPVNLTDPLGLDPELMRRGDPPNPVICPMGDWGCFRETGFFPIGMGPLNRSGVGLFGDNMFEIVTGSTEQGEGARGGVPTGVPDIPSTEDSLPPDPTGVSQNFYDECVKRADIRLQGALSNTTIFVSQGGGELFVGLVLVNVGVETMIVGGATTGPIGVAAGGIVTLAGLAITFLGGHTLYEGGELSIKASEQHSRDLEDCARRYPNAQH